MEVIIHLPDDIAQHLQARCGDVARYVLNAWHVQGIETAY